MNIYTSELEYLREKVKSLEEALAKQEQVESVAIPEYVRDAAIHLHENGCQEPLFMVKAIVGWINNSTLNAQKALAKQEQGEPVARVGHLPETLTDRLGLPLSTPLYTTPQSAQKPWVGLTDEEIDYYIVHRCGTATKKNLVELIRLCEIKLKEKNT